MVYCKCTVRYPTQVTVLNSSRILEKGSDSVLNYDTFREDVGMVVASEVLSHPHRHVTLSLERGTEDD